MTTVMLMTLVLPLSLGIYLVKQRQDPALYLAGSATFLASQMLFRIPMLYIVLPQFSWYLRLQLEPVWYALFLSATAGLVEESVRLLVLSWIHKRRQGAQPIPTSTPAPDLKSTPAPALKSSPTPLDHRQGIIFGLGHGGIEAMLFVGIKALVSLVLWDQVSKTLPIETPHIILIGGIERILAVTFHVGASLTVLYGIRVGKPILWTAIAIGAHTLLNFTATLAIQAFPDQIVIVELLVGLLAIATLGLSQWLWKYQWRWRNQQSPFKQPINKE